MDTSSPLVWIRNPVFDGGAMPCFAVDDRVLIAIPPATLAGGKYELMIIIATDNGWEATDRKASWCDWDWSDVEYYIPLDGERAEPDEE